MTGFIRDAFFLLFLVIVQTPPNCAVSIEVSISADVTEPGREIIVVCRVTRIHPGLTIRWQKAAEDGTADYDIIGQKKGEVVYGYQEVFEEIAINTTLTSLYQELGRFNITVVPVGSTLIFILKISNVKVEDTGFYTCTTRHSDQNWVGLIVHKSPTRMHFVGQAENERSPGPNNHSAVVFNGTLQFHEHVPQSVICRVIGVLPLPTVSVRFRRVTYAFVADLGEFSSITHKNIHRSEAPSGGHKGEPPRHQYHPLHYDWSVDFISINMISLRSEDDDGILVCESHNSMHTEHRSHILTVLVDVRHAPKFNCAKVLRTSVGQTNYVISCSVKSNPEVRSTEANFTIHGKSHVLKNGDGAMGVTLQWKQTFQKLGIVSLTIETVFVHHLTNYRLTTENEIGEGSVDIQLADTSSLPSSAIRLATISNSFGKITALTLSDCLTTLVLSTLFRTILP